MPRLPRIYIEGTLYYVTCRAAAEHKLFREKKDFEMYIELLKKYRKEYKFKLFSFVLLPNHIHLLIEPSDSATISEIMHVLTSSYSKYYNATYQRKGHLFRERFKSCLIEKDPHLARVTAYMHSNPKRLNLVLSPEEYPYSSASIYMGNREGFEEEVTEVLGYLKGEEYFDYLRRVSQEPSLELHKSLQRRSIFGSKDFIQKMRALIKEKEEEVKRLEAPRIRKRIILAGLGIGIIVLGIVAALTYRLGKKKAPAPIIKEVPVIKEVPIAKPKDDGIINTLEELDSTEWKVKLVSIDSGDIDRDVLTFIIGKFISSNLNQQGFGVTNYSVYQEGGKIVWETVQKKGRDTASWRGEVKDNKMQGILSLRLDGQVQDFSFMSEGFKSRGR